MINVDEKLFSFVWNHSQEIFICYDKTGIINFANEITCELTGYKSDEIKGIFIGELLTEVFAVDDGKLKIIADHQEFDMIETVIYRKNKTCFPVELKLAATQSGEDEVCFCMAIDMTRYKESIRKIEEKTLEVEEALKTRDSFVANVTHELRTPLNGIKGHVELMQEKETSTQNQNYLRVMLDCCTTMEGIINNILDFSKLEAGKFQIEEKSFSFREMTSKMEKVFSNLAGRKGIRFTMNVASDIPDRLIGDELRINQIMNNLVSNAVKFTAQGYVGVEIVKNMQVHDEIELFFMVIDTGIGLSPEDKDKLFKSFSQVDASITRKYGGTGLGLSITKELVNMMHGDIWVEGKKGKGSTFSFTIRLKLEEYADNEDMICQIPKWRSTELLNSMAGQKELMYEFGNEINARELKNSFEKLNISMDMDNWYKAETEVANVKQLLTGASKELQRAVFKLEMAVRKADYEKSVMLSKEVGQMLRSEWILK